MAVSRLLPGLMALTALILAPAGAAARKAGEVAIDAEKTVMVDGAALRYELGTLYVPENRAVAGSRIIGVGFARIRAPKPTGAPPVFWLPGGPGLSVLGAFSGEDGAQGRLRHWASFAEVGDIVIIEQRGYSVRGEMLELETKPAPLDRPASIKAAEEAAIAEAKAAAEAYPGKDLSGYTIVQCAEDVNDLRKALGYERISLFGGSFGSQWSLATIRLHPESVARAVLSSVEPLDGYDSPSQVYAALQRIAFDADRDPGLAPYLPEGGVMAAVRDIHDRLAAGPIKATVTDEETGEAVSILLGPEDFQLALTSHTAEGAEWPAFILSIYHGRYEEWARDMIEERRASRMTVIRPLIDTSLGVTAERAHWLRTDPAADMIGGWRSDIDIASAKAWPTPDVGDEMRVARESLTPVVFVHGDWDDSTPVENTLSLLPHFPNGRAIIVHRAGHDGTFYQLREQPAAKAAIYDFLRTGETADLPSSVSLSLPRFALPAFPPPR